LEQICLVQRANTTDFIYILASHATSSAYSGQVKTVGNECA